MTDRLPIRSIAILGAGLVGLSAAIAFARALPGVAITLVETPADPAALADRMPGTLPAITAFHDRIGLSERDLLAAGATHRIGTRLAGWGPDGTDMILAHGGHGGPVAPGAFHQHWLNARRAGRVAPFAAFSTAATLAAADRFVHPSDDPASPFATFGHALRLDPPRTRDLLQAYARHLGIIALAGGYAGVERRPDGDVATLVLADGRRIQADLYCDCSGPAAPLHAAVDSGWADWDRFLPVDRLLLGTAPGRTATPTDDLAALPAGWRFARPLRDRTLTGFAHLSTHTSDAAARRILPSGTDMVTVRPGIRTRPWIHNVLALGDAAVALDPLADANLHLAHAAILRAIDLLPGRDCAYRETAEYNRRTHLHAAAVRDYQAAHLLARQRGDFWKAAARLPRPDSLIHLHDQFAHRGRLPYREEDPFDADAWRALLLGMGIFPRVPDPVASATPPERLTATLRHMAADIAALPARLPPYPAYLAQIESRS